MVVYIDICFEILNRLLLLFCHVSKVTTFSQVVSAKVEQAKDATGNIRIPGLGRKDKSYTLLVIDDANTDW